MLSIVAGHFWITPETRLAFYTWHLPVFFVLSGYLWSGRRGFKGEIVNRARTLLVPTVAWLLIVGLAVALAALIANQTGTEPVLVNPFWAFWFPPALFVAAAVYYPISKLPLAAQWAIAVALFAVIVYLPWGRLMDLATNTGVPQGIAAVLFLVAGRTLRISQERFGRDTLVGGTLLAMGVLLALLFPTSYLDVKSLHFGQPFIGVAVAALIGSGLILLATVLFRRVTGVPARIITRLSMASLVVMFVHVPIADAFGWLDQPSAAGFAATVFMSWAIGLLALIPSWGFILTGVKKPPRQVTRDGREPSARTSRTSSSRRSLP